MEYPESTFYVSLSEKLTPRNAYDLLARLGDESDDLWARLQERPRETFLEELGVDFGDDIAPVSPVLPPQDQFRRVVSTLTEGQELRFELDPFAPYVPGQRPFIAFLLLAALASV